MAGEHVHRIGLIIAAGRGRRMGGGKQFATVRTPDGEKPLITAAFDTIDGICDRMVVVLGHEATAVADALAPRRFHRVDSDPDAEMIESIRAGLSAAGALDPAATIVLQPGDHPWVSPETLASLIAIEETDRVVVPEYGGRGGHPIFIPPSLAARIAHEECPGGLGRYWSEHPELVRRLAVNDADVVRDVDTPEQLRD